MTEFRPKRIVAPAEPVVSLTEIKRHLRAEDFSEDDTVMQGFVAAATDHVDGPNGILGRCLVTQTWQFKFTDLWNKNRREVVYGDHFPFSAYRRHLIVPLPDVTVQSVKYVDTDNLEQTVSDANYNVYRTYNGSVIEYIPSFDAPILTSDQTARVTVEVTAGFGGAVDVPEAIKAAIKLIAGDMYENREDAVVGASIANLPRAANHLLAPYTWVYSS